MTDTSFAVNGSAGEVLSASDGGLAGRSFPPGPPSRLAGLKAERGGLRIQMAQLEEASRELEQASGRVAETQSAQTRISEETAAAVRQWVANGCAGPQPTMNEASAG
jgi:hypothetical protein